MTMKIPTIQIVLDAESLGAWLIENAQNDLLAAGAGNDSGGAPFAAWIDQDLWPESDAMAVMVGSVDDDEQPAGELLEFPVFVLKTGW